MDGTSGLLEMLRLSREDCGLLRGKLQATHENLALAVEVLEMAVEMCACGGDYICKMHIQQWKACGGDIDKITETPGHNSVSVAARKALAKIKASP